MSSIDTVALCDFILVATHGGFRRASRESGRSKATLSRHVADLEIGLGLRLVERSEKGLRLTDAGEELLAGTRGPLAEIDKVAEAISAPGGRLRGTLRISAAIVFAHTDLTRIAAAFALEHPDLNIEIVADDQVADPIENGFDIAIRANPAAEDRLVGRRIRRTDRVAVAAPSLEMPNGNACVRAIVRSAEMIPASWRLRSNSGLRTVALRPVLHLSTLLMMRGAALHGAGVALLPRTLVSDDLKAGNLFEWGVLDGPQTEIWALHTSRRLPSAKVRAFLEYLEAGFD